MTAIRGFVEAVRRPGVLGVHSLDHFSLTVPDLAKASDFYELFGLTVRPEARGFGVYTQGNAHRWATLTEGPRKKLHYLSFGAFEDDLPRFRDHFRRLNVERLNPPPGFESNGLWFRDHDGLPVEIRVAEKSSPNAKSSFATTSCGPAERGALSRSRAEKIHPRRLAHLALHTADVGRAVKFYSMVLGLRLSDSSEGAVAFMHGVHGSDHHLVAFGKSNGPGLHHCSWDVGAVREIGLGAMQMANKGFIAGWGVGQHVLGSNYFHYVRDPWGSYSEYSADMDYIPVDVDWAAGDHPGEDSFYLWGPTPPADFGRNYEAEA
jgi:catechol 2,3-dioxygenase